MRVLLTSVVCAACVVASAATAGAQPIEWSVKGGLNVATLALDDQQDAAVESRLGLVAGAAATWAVSDRLAVQPELLYSQKGARFDNELGGATFALDFIEVPLLARYTVLTGARPLHVFAGPVIGFKVRAVASAEVGDQEIDQDLSDDIASTDVGIAAGAGLDFGRSLVEGRYTFGLKTIDKDNGDSQDAKTRVLSVMVGVRF